MSYLAAALAGTILLLVVAIQNPDRVGVRFLVWNGQVPLVLLIIIAAVSGALLTVAASAPRQFRLARELREVTAKARAQADELGLLQRAVSPSRATSEALTASAVSGVHAGDSEREGDGEPRL